MSVQYADTSSGTDVFDRKITTIISSKIDNTIEGTLTISTLADLENRAMRFIQTNKTTFEELAKL